MQSLFLDFGLKKESCHQNIKLLFESFNTLLDTVVQDDTEKFRTTSQHV